MKDNSKGYEEIIELRQEMNIVEEFLNVDASLVEIEKNKDLIRMEMNIVEFPIFSKSSLIKVNQIRKYYFSADKKSFLEILPAVNTQIPGEIEERVFIALTKILRNNGFSKIFYCTINDIFDNMKIDSKATRKGMYLKIKQAISKMATTTYRFQNIFYANELRGIISDLVETSILNFSSITIKDANSNEKNFFTDKRTKEIYKISISDNFYENIIRKGYLTFDADELLSIKDSVTRAIYTMITKWRNDKLYLKKAAYYIARRIPLAWDKNPRRTVLRIEESFKNLREFGYITNYKFNKKSKYETAEFEIFFDESHNKIKRENFYDEKETFDKMVHMIEDRQQEVSLNTTNFFTDEYFMEIFNTFPDVAKKFKTLPNVIREGLKKFDYKYVKYTAEYTALFCKTSYIKYFKDALENNWADEYIAKKENKEVKKIKNNNQVIEDAILVEEAKEIAQERIELTWEDFEKLEKHVKEEIESATYEEYLMEIGSNDNKVINGIFQKSKKSLILKTFNKYQNLKEQDLKVVVEVNEIKEKKSKVIKKENKINETRKNDVFSDKYDSMTHFMLSVNDFAKENNIEINFHKIAPIFKAFMEYEDKNIKIIYNESTGIGEVIKK